MKPVFKVFMDKKLIEKNFRVCTEKLLRIKVKKVKKNLGSIFYGGKKVFLGLKISMQVLKPKPFRRFCCLSNWNSHYTSNVHSHLTM